MNGDTQTVLSALFTDCARIVTVKDEAPWLWQSDVGALLRGFEALFLGGSSNVIPESVLAELSQEDSERSVQPAMQGFGSNAAGWRIALARLRDAHLGDKLSAAIQRAQANATANPRETLEVLRRELDGVELALSRTDAEVYTRREAVQKPGGLIELMDAPPDDGRGERITTGIEPLDIHLGGGVRRGNLVVIAARPNVGKSFAASQMAAEVGKSRRSILFSLEMDENESMIRLARQSGFGVDGDAYVGLSHRNQSARHEFLTAVDSSPGMRLCCPIKPTLEFIRARCEQMHRTGGLDCVVIDYVSPDMMRLPKADARYIQVSEATGALKALARTLQVPVVAVTQLNRNAEGVRPTLRDLRESGAWEQDADIVVLLHRDRAESGTELHVPKNRGGLTTKEAGIPLTFNTRTTRFEAPRIVQQFQL